MPVNTNGAPELFADNRDRENKHTRWEFGNNSGDVKNKSSHDQRKRELNC
jgi:hypothetical protein